MSTKDWILPRWILTSRHYRTFVMCKTFFTWSLNFTVRKRPDHYTPYCESGLRLVVITRCRGSVGAITFTRLVQLPSDPIWYYKLSNPHNLRKSWTSNSPVFGWTSVPRRHKDVPNNTFCRLVWRRGKEKGLSLRSSIRVKCLLFHLRIPPINSVRSSIPILRYLDTILEFRYTRGSDSKLDITKH